MDQLVTFEVALVFEGLAAAGRVADERSEVAPPELFRREPLVVGEGLLGALVVLGVGGVGRQVQGVRRG